MNIEYNLLPHQMKMLESQTPTTALVAGRGAGKSYISSLIIALNLIAGRNVVATAQTYKMLKFVLFKEVQERLTEMHATFYSSNIEMTISVPCGGNKKSILYGFSADSAQTDSIRGLTEISILVIDEAALASKEFFQICSATLRGTTVKNPRIYLISTPRAYSWFNEFCHSNPECVISASSYDNTYLDKSYFKILENLYSGDFLEQEIYGKMISQTADNQLISRVAFIAIAFQKEKITGPMDYLGIDVARFGGDSTVCYGCRDNIVTKCFSINGADSFGIISNIKQFATKNTKIVIDGTGGYASGVVDLLLREGYDIQELNFGSSADDRYCSNKRSEIYQAAKKLINDRSISTNRDDQLLTELEATRYELDQSGRIKIIPKDDIKKILDGKSPDNADSFALCCYAISNHNRIYQPIDDNRMKSLIDA